MTELPNVTIYTDGACIDNPGPGGYGVVLLSAARRTELSGGFRLTTNNRMELMAAIKGLQALKRKCHVTVYTDSQYLADSAQHVRRHAPLHVAGAGAWPDTDNRERRVCPGSSVV